MFTTGNDSIKHAGIKNSNSPKFGEPWLGAARKRSVSSANPLKASGIEPTLIEPRDFPTQLHERKNGADTH